MLEKGGKIKLIDFGASKQLGANGTLTTNAPTAFAQTPGYAPREQMEQNLDKIGPWTDIYALGATLYNLLTNNKPPLPTDIDDDMSDDKHNALPFPNDVSEEMKSLVLMMLYTNRLQRPQSVSAIVDIITSMKEEPKQAFNQQLKVQDSINFDDEATIINKRTNNQNQQSSSDGKTLVIHPLPNYSVKNKNGNNIETGKLLIDYTTPAISFIGASLLSFGILYCLLIILAPIILYEQRYGAPFSVPFQSSVFFELVSYCTMLFPILTSIMYGVLARGLWIYNKEISSLLILCSFLTIAKLCNDFLDNEEIGWYLFYCEKILGLLCGIYITIRCTGNIILLGWCYIFYYLIISLLNIISVTGIEHMFEKPQYIFYSIAIWGIDLLWVFGMWWMLTRRPTKETNYYEW